MQLKNTFFYSKRFLIFLEWSQKIYDKRLLMLEINFPNSMKKRLIYSLKRRKKKKLKMDAIFSCLSLSSIRLKKPNLRKTVIDGFPSFLYYLQNLLLSINFILYYSFFSLRYPNFF